MSWGEKDGRIYGRKQAPAWPGPQTSLVPTPVPASGVGGPDGWCFAWLSGLAWALSEQHALLRAVSAWASTSCPFQEERNTRWVGRRRGAAQPLRVSWATPAVAPPACCPCALASAHPLQPAGTSSLSRPPNPAVQGHGGPEAGRMSGASRAGWGLDHRLFQGTVGCRSSCGQRLPVARPWRAQPCPGLLAPSQPCTPKPCLGGAHGPQLVTSGQRHGGLPPLQPGPAGCWERGQPRPSHPCPSPGSLGGAASWGWHCGPLPSSLTSSLVHCPPRPARCPQGLSLRVQAQASNHLLLWFSGPRCHCPGALLPHCPPPPTLPCGLSRAWDGWSRPGPSSQLPR